MRAVLFFIANAAIFVATTIHANNCESTLQCKQQDGSICQTMDGHCPGCLSQSFPPGSIYRRCIPSKDGVCAAGYDLCSGSSDLPVETPAPTTTTTSLSPTTTTTKAPKPSTTAQPQAKTVNPTTVAPTTTSNVVSTTTVAPSTTAPASVVATQAEATSSFSSTPIAFAVGGVAFVCLAVFVAKKYKSRRNSSDSSDSDEYIPQPSTKPVAHPQPSASDFAIFKPTPVRIKATETQTAPSVVTRESRQGTRTSIDFEIHAMPSPMQDNQHSFGGHGDLWDEVEKINSQRAYEEGKRGTP